MNSRPLALAATSLAALTAAVCAALSAPPVRPVAVAPPMDAAHLAQLKSLYSEKCSACHNLPNPDEKGFTRREWQQTVDRMLNRHHASDSISAPEAAQIVDYLATFAPLPGAQNGRSSDPWGTDAIDVPSAAPTTTRVFNFASPEALTNFGMVSAGAPGPAPLWHLAQESQSPDGMAALVRPVRPSPSRFALLMDRRDQARDLDIRVKFHIVSGKVTPAVGLVFGFTGPKDYNVLVYNQAKNDLTLIKIAEPVHTPLQETPINLPAGPAQTAAQVVTPAAATGWHTLRLLVKQGQVRGWLDYSKRISYTEDATYQGGQVGLWAQGDTVAAFQDWLVDIYDNAGAAPPAGV